MGLSLATGLLFGLVPALVTSRADLNAVIKDSSSRSGSGFGQNKTRSLLVVVEVGLAVVLLIGASLLIRTSLALSQVDPGFTATNVLTMRTSLSGPRFSTSGGVEQTVRTAMYQIEIGECFSLAPQLNLDLLGRDTVPVFGISVGYGF